MDLNTEAAVQQALSALDEGDVELAKATLRSLWAQRPGSRKLFEQFIKAYPSEQDVWLARIQWGKLGITPPMMRPIMEALEADKKSRKFRDGFIPNPSKWLASRPWMGRVVRESAISEPEHSRSLRDQYLGQLPGD